MWRLKRRSAHQVGARPCEPQQRPNSQARPNPTRVLGADGAFCVRYIFVFLPSALLLYHRTPSSFSSPIERTTLLRLKAALRPLNGYPALAGGNFMAPRTSPRFPPWVPAKPSQTKSRLQFAYSVGEMPVRVRRLPAESGPQDRSQDPRKESETASPLDPHRGARFGRAGCSEDTQL